MEDQVYKGLALGAPYINIVGIGRQQWQQPWQANK